ncbi:DUF1592 domain-containing protein [Candidatus Rariloculus sp.]|uniref:DUF1592 domain-containing protein n=1 Tax=Candidatus Rariloculus sp. TaxID=3101265 RepID=UPI003D14459F
MKTAVRFSLGAAAILVAGCTPTPEQLAERHTATIDRYCLDCHNEIDREAGLVLERIDLADTGANAETFEKMTRKLRGRLMPPTGGPRPDARTVDELVAWLETSLDTEAEANQRLGRMSIHRINRTEYGNAVRDLLGVEIDSAEFLPADDEGYGFDNIADILRVSPSLLEQYLAASSKVASLAVGDPDTPAVSTVHRVPPDLAQGGHVEGLPLGTRGGTLIRYNFPLDAEYDFSVFLIRNIVGYMTGLEWPHELEITIDGEHVFLAPVGGVEDNAMSDANFSAAANMIDERLRTRVFVEAGPRDVGVAFLRRNAAETHEPLELHTRDLDLQNMNGLPLVDYFMIGGPYDAVGPGRTPSRERIFSCVPERAEDEPGCAEEIISRLARLAFRGPVAEESVAMLLDLYRTGREGGTFDTGIRNALRVILTSPEFLFRDAPAPEDAAPGTIYPIDDLTLASRLSFFLWSSIPDDELLDLAEQGRLSDPGIYAAQVDRMAADARSHALVENFAGQWLYLRNLQSARPGVETFPDFDENLRRAMRRETELLFESIIREDRGVTELLTADYTFVNERLAKHYGMAGIYGSHFRRAAVVDDARRGLLGHASILTVTSYPNRTSPVLRGKWIMENILGTPPPAPPADVPDLEENEPGGAARSVRERLAEHRENPVCANCHDVMDPIGLGLENFDAVGRWRTKEAGGDVDPSGRLADGTLVDGAVSLREALMSNPEQFVGVFTEKLFTYALGRGLEYYDMPAVRAIVRQAAAEDYRFSALVRAILTSDQFRMNMVQAESDPDATTAAVRP